MNASIVEHFSILKDPRIEQHKKHHLVDIILLAIAEWKTIRRPFEPRDRRGSSCKHLRKKE